MKYSKYEIMICKLVDGLYISGALLLFFTAIVFALRYL